MEMNPNQPQSQTKVPPPPTPEVSVRTMQSDIRSISQGEVNPTPEIVAPKQSFNLPEPTFTPEVTNQIIMEEGATAKASHKGLWMIITLAVIVALGAVGYFIVYPMMSAPVVTPTVTENAAPTQAPAPVIPAHSSAFNNSATQVPQVTLRFEAVTREMIIEGLTAQGAAITDGMTEVIMQDTTGGQLPMPAYIVALLPDFLDGQSAGSYVADDFTTFIYKDKTGVWPGYVASVKPEGATTLSQWLMNLEKTNLGALFVTDPGALSPFKDGTVKGVADRFATGKTPGASLSYAVAGSNLVISTSFEGMKAVLGALGY